MKKQYHFVVVVTVEDGEITGTNYDGETPVGGGSDGWVWNETTENWEDDWDAGADTAYDKIKKMLATADTA